MEKANKEKAFYPLSYGQKALFFLYLDSPESASYNVAFAARILSKLDKTALRKAFQRLINRHPVLRTRYLIKDGKPVQEVPVYSDLHFEETDVSDLTEEQIKERVIKKYKTPFDLHNGPVFRVDLFTINDKNNILLINMHHIVSDGWTLLILLNEIGAYYSAETRGKGTTSVKITNYLF